MAAVAAYGEGGVDFDGAGGRVGADADDAMAGVFDEAGGLVLHEEVEGGVVCGLGGEEVEEVPLGHEGDEFCVGGEVGEVGDGKVFAADGEDELGDLLVGKGEEGVEDAELVHEFEGGGVDGVAAEVAEEVFVLFEDGDVDGRRGRGGSRASCRRGLRLRCSRWF